MSLLAVCMTDHRDLRTTFEHGMWSVKSIAPRGYNDIVYSYPVMNSRKLEVTINKKTGKKKRVLVGTDPSYTPVLLVIPSPRVKKMYSLS